MFYVDLAVLYPVFDVGLDIQDRRNVQVWRLGAHFPIASSPTGVYWTVLGYIFFSRMRNESFRLPCPDLLPPASKPADVEHLSKLPGSTYFLTRDSQVKSLAERQYLP